MKNILFIALILLTSIVQCQMTSNIITEPDFNNIEIKGIKLSDIIATNGNETQIINLILFSIEEKTIELEESYFYYKYDGFDIGFSDNELGGFTITKNNWSFKILGNTVKIGDDISLLGSVTLNTNTDGSKSIVYQTCNGCNDFIYINFNESTNLITEIGYIDQT